MLFFPGKISGGEDLLLPQQQQLLPMAKESRSPLTAAPVLQRVHLERETPTILLRALACRRPSTHTTVYSCMHGDKGSTGATGRPAGRLGSAATESRYPLTITRPQFAFLGGRAKKSPTSPFDISPEAESAAKMRTDAGRAKAYA